MTQPPDHPRLPGRRGLHFILLLCLLALWSVAYSDAFVPAAYAQSPQIASAADQDVPLYLPVVYQKYPRPRGYDYEIARRIQLLSYELMDASTSNLVLNFSPRHNEVYYLFANWNTCTLGGTRYANHNLMRALKDTENEFARMGYEIFKEPVPNSAGSYNLIAYKAPSGAITYPEVIEIGAHLDARTTTPGASDNAAGMAGVLEIARTLSDYPNQHPWRFIAFVEEEDGLIGSAVHVNKILGEPFKAALVMDGIGWSELEPEYMNCIYDKESIPYTVTIANLFDEVRQLYGIDTHWRRCTYTSRFSDQGRYWDVGLPAVLSVGGLPYKDPTIHKCADNLEGLDLMNAYLAVQENLGVLLTLDLEP